MASRFPRLPPHRQRFLTVAELQDLADRAGDYRLMVLVLGLRGLRFGECVALRVRMLGHKDAAITLNVYASLFENDLDDVSDRLDAALPQAAAAVCSLDSRPNSSN